MSVKEATGAVAMNGVTTPYRVICEDHGPRCLTHSDYLFQMNMPGALWKCPICHQDSGFDDAWYERMVAMCDVEFDLGDKTHVGIVDRIDGHNAVVHVYEDSSEHIVPAKDLRDAPYVSGGQS